MDCRWRQVAYLIQEKVSVFNIYWLCNGTCWILFSIMTRSSLIHFEIADFVRRGLFIRLTYHQKVFAVVLNLQCWVCRVFHFLNCALNLACVLIEVAFLSFWAKTSCLDHSPSKPFAQSVDYFLLHLRSTVDSFHRSEGLKHALVATGKVDDHYHICPQSIQSQLNAASKGHCGKYRQAAKIYRDRLRRWKVEKRFKN